MTAHQPTGKPVVLLALGRRCSLFLIALLMLVGCSGPRSATPTPPPPTTTATAPASTAAPTRAPLATPSAVPATPMNPALGEWVAAGTLGFGRAGHTATLLPDGHVLVVGGEGGSAPLASAEQYDPQTNGWIPAPSLGLARTGHTATLLASGEVLVVGGVVAPSGAIGTTPTVELFDPVAGRWRNGSPLNQARSAHTATLLPSGRVLVVGGEVLDAATGQSRPVASAELYDPESGIWTVVAAPERARVGHIATLLSDGRVLVAGGETGGGGAQREVTATAELFDPATGGWAATGALLLGRVNHTATLLADGRVLLVGGRASGGTPTASAELYDPGRGSWSSAAAAATPRTDHTATRLQDGRVMIVGGLGRDALMPLASAERYDAATNSWAQLAAPDARTGQRARLLADGLVLVVGGRAAADRYVKEAERFVPRGIVPVTPGASATPRPTATSAATAPLPATVAPPAAPPPTAVSAAPTATAVAPRPTARPPTSAPPVRPTPTPTEEPPLPTEVPPAPTEPPPAATAVVPLPTATMSAPPPTMTVPPTLAPVPSAVILPSPTGPVSTPPPRGPTATVTPTTTPTAAPTATSGAGRTGTIFGTVQFCTARRCDPAAGAVVATDSGATRTDDGGVYALTGIAAGQVRVNVSYTPASGGTYTATQSVSVQAGGRVQLNFTLQPAAQGPDQPLGEQTGITDQDRALNPPTPRAVPPH